MELREGEPLKAGEKEVGGVYQWRGGGWSLYSNREGCEWSLAIESGGWSLYSNREGYENVKCI